MKLAYALFNIAVLIMPTIASVTRYGRGLLPPLKTLAVVYATAGTLWVVLDVFSHAWGWWDYNPRFILGPEIAGLPVEEVLFFVTVPLACLLCWGLVQRFSVPGVLRARTFWQLWVSLFLLAAGFLIVGWDEPRTRFDALLMMATLLALYNTQLARQKQFWLWNILIFGLFLIANTYLTALPIVIYNESAMLGSRLGTIPYEDILYNFSLLNSYLLVWYVLQRRKLSSVY